MSLDRVAAIDIGTNSVLLLVVERRGDRLVTVEDVATITRLGEGVGASGALTAAARARTLACLESYAGRLARARVDRLEVVGTSAMRDARGGREFAAEAGALLGVTPRVISGEEEAALTFSGALRGLGLEGDATVFDVGGGSTEIVVGAVGRAPSAACSLQLGSVRLHERHFASDPPSPDEVARLRADVTAALRSAPPPRGPLVGVAGTVTSLAALALGLRDYDPSRIHGAALSAVTVTDQASRLRALTIAGRRELTGLDPRRADVIAAGATLVEGVMGWAGARELVVSDGGVRWGLVLRALTR
ncbi:MAG: Ppx/GppA family phosphatase [Polyangiaceae bacterium]|nr:Ppx/GppA family phosphatase [Polyangiaceae bacterium]